MDLIKQGARDALGREFSDIIGFGSVEPIKIPVGSRVRLHKDPFAHGFFDNLYVGREAIVVEYHVGARAYDKDQVRVRFVEPNGEWEDLYSHHTTSDICFAEVLTVGDGTVKEGAYRFSKLEIARAKYRAMDHRHQGWSNPKTFLAALYLEQDPRHSAQVLAMARKDGTINPARLGNYFRKAQIILDRWSEQPEGFPSRWEFMYAVNFSEIARHFEQKVAELSVRRAA